MTLPRFFSRTAAAIDMIIGDGAEAARARLGRSHVTISLHDGGHEAGFTMSVNLAARLFPAMDLQAGGDALTQALDLARAINPDVEFGPPPPNARTVTIRHGATADIHPASADIVDVSADGWNVRVDQPGTAHTPAHPAAAMMAGVLGVAEAFRHIFADVLPHPRTAATPTGWNLLDFDAPHHRAPVEIPVDLGTLHLAGAGAVGQAAVATLAAWPHLTGTLVPVDPDTVELSNLQRYILTLDTSVDEPKTDMVAAALSDTAITADPRQVRWDACHSAEARRVMVALDTARDRIGVQAGLPGAVYNAYTGQHDLGWSRHEHFGTDACLTCLYLPTSPAPSRTAQVADALAEPEPRIALYYVTNAPVGEPLPRAALASLQGTESAWAERSLLDDIATRHDLPDDRTDIYRHAHIDRFYGQAVCGGTLLPVPHAQAAVLPLPHVSAAAGIMLAVQTVASTSDTLRPHLSAIPAGRLDLLTRPTPYIAPMARTPGCICDDPDYRDIHRARWADPDSYG